MASPRPARPRPRLRLLALPLLAALAPACADDGAPPPPAGAPVFRAVPAPIGQAYCTAIVEGKGARDTETDYIPHVIQCENGGADLEALKAQAIAARSVLYYAMATKGSICDGQGCQVYSCGASPKPIHYQAAAETAGQYLSFGGLLTYGFYVDGDHTPDAGTCMGSPQGNNEKYVTYNDGKTGAGVKQTPLGYIGPPGYGQNRGCMAQWGARCLEKNKGKSHLDILRFYYGADIQVLTAPGNCTGCEPGCEGSKIIGADCGKGDCAAFGANCVDDELGPRCVFFACPPQGTAKVCVDDEIIGTCDDGQITTGDCSAYAAYCSTKVGDEARCVSVFCAAPGDTPVPHAGCFLDGQPFECDALGQITFDPCPEGEACSVYPELHCAADLGCPPEGEGSVCVDAEVIGHCYGGGVHNTTDCAVYDGACAVVDGAAICVPKVCVDAPGEAPHDHDVCLGDGSVGHCFADGSLATTACPPGLVCVDVGQAYCGDPGPDASTGAATAGESEGEGSSGGDPGSTGDPGGDAGAGGDPGGASASATGGSDDAAGCGCRGAAPPPGGPLGALLLLLLAGARRRRADARSTPKARR